MNTNMKSFSTKVFAIGITLATLLSCNEANYKGEVEMYDVSEATKQEQSSIATTALTQQGKIATPSHLKIIKTATTRYKVDDVKIATAAIKEMATTYGAYISELQFNNTLYEKQNKFTIKVPNTYFESMMDTIAGTAAFIEFENITTQDVTEEFMDISARLKTKKEVKDRIEQVLQKRAATVEDILLTEDKLRVIQEEIESAQGRLKYLTERVSYSTIHVDLYETVTYKEEPESYTKGFSDKAKNGFSTGWSIVEGIVLALITIWPILLMVILIGLFVKFYLKKRKG